MRFAVRDYYCAPARLTVNNKIYSVDEGNYYYEMTIFKNLDIFTFEFENKYQKSTIIPVLAEPVDVIPSVETTRDPNGNDKDDKGDGLWNLITTILLIVAGLTVIGLVIYWLDKLGFDFGKFFRALWKLIKRFFKWLFKWIKIGWQKLIAFIKKVFSKL